jgi:hypothetical protein
VILAAALAALAVAIAATAFQLAGVPWTVAVERLDVLTFAGFALLVVTTPLATVDRGFASVVRFVAFAIGLGGLLVLSTTAANSVLSADRAIVEGVYQAVMFIACVTAMGVAIRWQWSETVNLAAVFFALFLLIRFVDWFWDVLPRYVFFLVLAALSFAWLVALRRLRGRLVAGTP